MMGIADWRGDELGWTEDGRFCLIRKFHFGKLISRQTKRARGGRPLLFYFADRPDERLISTLVPRPRHMTDNVGTGRGLGIPGKVENYICAIRHNLGRQVRS